MSDLSQRTCSIEQYRDASNLNARVQLHALFSTNPRGWHRWVFEQIELQPAGHMLELGCGPGLLWAANRDRTPPAWRVTLSDLSPGMLQEARGNLRPLPRLFTLAVADAQMIPFPRATFDAVIANHMLYHVPHRGQAIAEMRRVLNPAGRVYVATVGSRHLHELNELVRHFAPRAEPFDGGTVNPFTLENGHAQLAAWFPQVALRRYEDSLRITAVEPLIAYLLSTPSWKRLLGDKLERLTCHLQEKLASDGAIRVTKDSGLFIAWGS